MKELLLIDLNNILHRGFSVHEHLSFAGKSTGGLYGFVSQLATLISNHPTQDIIVCLDAKPYLRSKRYPEYKMLRQKQKDPERDERLHFNRLAVIDFLEFMSIKVWEEKGMEADDLIAAACDDYSSSYDRIVVASNDDDLYQLFRNKNVFFKSKKGNKKGGLDGLYGWEDFQEDNPGMNLRRWMRLLMMKGTHNDVAGIKGIGPAKAEAVLREGRWKEFYNQHQEQLDLFHDIIKLPYYNNLDVPFSYTSGFNERSIMKFLAGYGIEYTGRMRHAFSILNDE